MQRLMMIAAVIAFIFGNTGTCQAETITIMAANISSGNYQSYEDPGIRIFQGLQPDIVLIQEFTYRDGTLDQLVDTAFGSEYDYMIETGDENIPNGVVSRFPIISSGQWEDPQVPDRDFAWAIIDIPGDIHLQCISVHFKADSSSAGIRAQEAQAILGHIDANFDPAAYIVLGGDLNTRSLDEEALSILDTELALETHVPVDQNGNRYTSEPRTKPYDWCIPNDLLDARHTALVIGSSTYPDGLVFDSAVYTPLNEVAPVQFGDSHVNGMQHMAVMKAFDVATGSATATPLSTATPTPSYTATPTPVPTWTPTHTVTHTPTWTFTPSLPTGTPSATPTAGPGSPTHTPAATATPVCAQWGCEIDMPADAFAPGDTCYCRVRVCNAGEFRQDDLRVFVILDVYGSLFFAPDFSDFSYFQPVLMPGETILEILPVFSWPPGAGSADSIFWYAGITGTDMQSLIGEIDIFEFGWHE